MTELQELVKIRKLLAELVKFERWRFYAHRDPRRTEKVKT